MDPDLMKAMQQLQETKRMCDDILKPRHTVRNVVLVVAALVAVACLVVFLWTS